MVRVGRARMNKPRRHPWVTEALTNNEKTLSVWPSPEEITNPDKQAKFFESIGKIGNDPRVSDVERRPHPDFGVIYIFKIDG